MEPCPYCASPIPSSYLVEGGICDNCGQLILGEDDLIVLNNTKVLKARMKKGRKVLAPAGKTHSTWNRMKK